MNSNVIKLLLGLCVFFSIILFLEWKSVDNQAIELLPVAEKYNDGGVDFSKLKLSENPVDHYMDMVERPLFVQTREPVVIVEEDNPVEVVGKIKDIVLLGIYSIEGKQKALFSQKRKEQKFVNIPEGGKISGWTLQEIQADNVIMQQAGKQQTILLRKARKKVKKVVVPPKKKKMINPFQLNRETLEGE